MKKQVLFVCMGNICRSPAAEGIMNKFLKIQNLEDTIGVDSAGTIGFHEGEQADHRMRVHAEKRGYKLLSRSRKFNPKSDFSNFDYIITMDDQNYDDIMSLDKESKYESKVFRMADFFGDNSHTEVPDPYYGMADGFELVLDLLEKGNKNLLTRILDDIGSETKKQH